MSIKQWCDKQATLHPHLYFFVPFVVVLLVAASATMLVHSSNPSLGQREELMSADGFKWNHNPHEVVVVREVAMSEDITHFLVRDVNDEDGHPFWVMGPAKFTGQRIVLILDGPRAAPGGTVTDGIVVGIAPAP